MPASPAIRGSTRTFRPATHELSPEEILARHGDLLSSALEAFGSEPGYVVDMAEHGALIHYKRELWSARAAAKDAESKAHAACSADGVRACAVQGPCGFGGCPFATAETRGLRIPPMSELPTRKRPQGRPRTALHPTYRIEDGIAAIVAARGIPRPPKINSGRRAS